MSQSASQAMLGKSWNVWNNRYHQSPVTLRPELAGYNGIEDLDSKYYNTLLARPSQDTGCIVLGTEAPPSYNGNTVKFTTYQTVRVTVRPHESQRFTLSFSVDWT